MGESIDKNQLRNHALEARHFYKASLSKDQEIAFAEKVYKSLLSLLASHKTKCISTYIPMNAEFDMSYVNSLFFDDGYQLCLPVVNIHDELSFHIYQKGQTLIKNNYKFLGPDPNSERVYPEVYLVPLVAFDEKCNRLGYGKGHYDRVLHSARSQFNVLAIGVAYDMQKVDSIPVVSHDQQMDYIVTEKAIYKTDGK